MNIVRGNEDPRRLFPQRHVGVMKVRAIRRQRSECPDEARRFIPGDGAFVTIGEEYPVYALSVFDGVVALQIVDDLRCPAWYPFVLFELLDHELPRDWQCALFPHDDLRGCAMVIGPEFVARDQAAYRAMVELEADQVGRFWKRVDLLSEEDVS